MKGTKAVAKQTNDGLSRRDFLKGAAVVGAAGSLGALGIPGIAGAATTSSEDWMPAKWDYTADVVVIGDGYAGQAAAIEADMTGIVRHHPREGALPGARRQQPCVWAGPAGPVARHLGGLQGVYHGPDGGPGVPDRPW